MPPHLHSKERAFLNRFAGHMLQRNYSEKAKYCMALSAPLYRTVRPAVDGPNSGYNGSRYITHRAYAQAPQNYVKAYLILQKELENIFDYIEPSDEASLTYSFKLHSVLMRACIEVEANFRAILAAHKFTESGRTNMRHYGRIDQTHHLSSYRVSLPQWGQTGRIFAPFGPWRQARDRRLPDRPKLPWYQAYNDSKHDRYHAFKNANLINTVEAMTGLLVLLHAQFRDNSFAAGPEVLLISEGRYYEMEASLSELFRISPPDDWSDDEKYGFEWNSIKDKDDPFERIDYDAIY